jgi:hypothetical protein
MTKTGSDGRPWVILDSPKPPRVTDIEDWWADPPPVLSDRCWYWMRQIERGWMPNRRISGEGYYGSADWYGVWIWEWLNIIHPLIAVKREECV